MSKVFELKRKSTLALRQRRQTLLRQLRPPPALLRASCVEQFLACGKTACACHQSPKHKHGPYYYLTLCLGVGKVRKFLLKTPDQQAQARAGSAAYVRFMEQVEELSQTNAELLRRGEGLPATQ